MSDPSGDIPEELLELLHPSLDRVEAHLNQIFNSVRNGDLDLQLVQDTLRQVRNGRVLLPGYGIPIDQNAEPMPITGCSIAFHNQWEMRYWDPSAFNHYFDRRLNPATGQAATGLDLQDAYRKFETPNSCILDFLLKYPVLIPNDWKYVPYSQKKAPFKKTVFWGTVYQCDDLLFVRYLTWGHDTSGKPIWTWGKQWLHEHWPSNCDSLVLRED